MIWRLPPDFSRFGGDFDRFRLDSTAVTRRQDFALIFAQLS
jgi:hypothetical protein